MPRRSAYVEVREKQTFDWALAAAAVDYGLDGRKIAKPRIVLGQVAPEPYPLPAVDKAIEGKPPTEELAREAGEMAARDATPLAQNAYKVQLVKVVVARAIMAAVQR